MFESTSQYLQEIWEIPTARWVVYLAVFSMLITIAIYVGKVFREMATGREEAVDYLAEFEKMREEGAMGDFEFAVVKSKMTIEQRGKLGEILGNEKAGFDKLDSQPKKGLPSDVPEFEEVTEEVPESKDDGEISKD